MGKGGIDRQAGACLGTPNVGAHVFDQRMMNARRQREGADCPACVLCPEVYARPPFLCRQLLRHLLGCGSVGLPSKVESGAAILLPDFLLDIIFHLGPINPTVTASVTMVLANCQYQRGAPGKAEERLWVAITAWRRTSF